MSEKIELISCGASLSSFLSSLSEDQEFKMYYVVKFLDDEEEEDENNE